MNRKIWRRCAGWMTVFMLFSGYSVKAFGGAFPEAEEVYVEIESRELIQNGGMGLTVHFAPDDMLITADGREAGWETELERRLLEMLQSRMSSVDISDLSIMMTETNRNEILKIYGRVLNTNPQYFYIGGGYSTSYNPETQKILKISVKYSTDYADSEGKNPDWSLIEKDQKAYYARMAQALACVNEEMSEIEKVLVLHDWLVRECDYDNANYEADTVPPRSHSAAGAFIDGICVCDGYAQAMCALLQKVGIDVYYVSSKEINHAWNIVKTDGNYYHLDATWDDPVFSINSEYKDKLNEGFVYHKYFIRSDDEIRSSAGQSSHTGWDTDSVPSCGNSGSYSQYLFRLNSETAYTYGNGWWYYKDGSSLYRADKLAGGTIQSYSADSRVISSFYYGDALYYATSAAVYKMTDIADSEFSGAVTKVYDIAEKYSDYVIHEFAIKNEKMIINSSNVDKTNFGEDEIALEPTAVPTPEPTTAPTAEPGATAEPTAAPTAEPGATAEPTTAPTTEPGATAEPTTAPTAEPDATAEPTTEPTQAPEESPKPADFGWNIEDGEAYWYENGVKQGTEGRGKEIYDPRTDAWYWLDAVQGGKIAKNKDVFMETENGAGKWVRYDENGRMVKGNDYRYGGWYHFDQATGEMTKGWYTAEDGSLYYYDMNSGRRASGECEIDGVPCYFIPDTGKAADCVWNLENNEQYWYEKGVRQGLEGRGKEIYDPASNAWYWLDSNAQGRKAVSKDVYQESSSAYPDREDGTGKWVRYDENGHMVKGWQTTEAGTYYFEEITGAMAKGDVTIDGKSYYFDWDTGILK